MLLIEKAVKLLDDFHYQVFWEYVKNMSLRSYYPLVLIEVIDRNIETEQESEWFCMQTYSLEKEEVDDKAMRKFFQLAHYTFNLTSFLATNYPNYLQHNITKVQRLFNEGQLKKATFLAETLLDVAQKIEDFDTEVKILNILIQRSVLLESAKQNQKYHQRIRTILNYQLNLNDIFEHLHGNFRAKGKTPENIDIEAHLEFFKQFKKSKSFAVRIISRFCICFALYYTRNENFYKSATLKELNAIEGELQKNSYVLLPYLFTINHRISLLKLNYEIRELDTSKILEDASKISEESENVLYWNSFVNLPEIFSIAVQSSHYASNFMTGYRDDHFETLPAPVKNKIESLKRRCDILLKNELLEQQFTLRYINLTTFYAGLLLVGSKKDIEKSINTLERLFIFYQQIPFHAHTDSIYSILMMAAFCLKWYKKMDEYLKRYKKVTKGKVVNPENDLTIHGVYYAGKWLDNGRSQYIKKLTAIYTKTKAPRFSEVKKLLLDIIHYFDFPGFEGEDKN